MLSAVALALLQQTDSHTQAWLALLRNVAKVESASLCVDIDEFADPGQVLYEKPDGQRGLDRLAASLDRARLTVQGVQVFRRRLDDQDLRLLSPTQHALAVIKALGVTEIEKLRQGNLNMSSLPASLQARLRFAIERSGAGVGDSMLAQYPDRVGMRLLFEPVATVASRSGDGAVSISLAPDRPDVPLPEATSQQALDPIGKPTDGQLDFRGGEVLTLQEIVDQAALRFGKTFLYDARLASSRYFLCGTFTEERLLAVLEAATSPSPVLRALDAQDAAQTAQEREAIVTRAFAPQGEQEVGVSGLTYNDLIHGKATSFKELFGNRAPLEVRSFMFKYHIQPEDAVQVSGDLYLAIAAPGLATLDSGQRDPTGRPIPYSVPHYIRLEF